MKVHEKIRFMRQSKNWSQDEMAEKLEMSLSGYAKIEQGKASANFAKLEKIAEIFEIDVMELLTLGEKNVICLMGENNMSDNGLQLTGTSDAEIQKLQLIIKHQKAMLEQKDKEIAYLKELLDMVKNPKS